MYIANTKVSYSKLTVQLISSLSLSLDSTHTHTQISGFTIEVTNLQPDTTVIVGVRVLLGCRSLERTPSYIEVFGRRKEVNTNSTCHRRGMDW